MNAVKFTPVDNEEIRVSLHHKIHWNPKIFSPVNNIEIESSAVLFHEYKPSTYNVMEYLQVPLSIKKKISVYPAISEVESKDGSRALPQSSRSTPTYEEWGYLVVDVIDRGCGIPEHARGNIFREFFQFDPDRLQGGGGSGMGLWISREIVRMHGGDITFGPGDDGVGTIFSVWLPAFKKELTVSANDNCRTESPTSQQKGVQISGVEPARACHNCSSYNSDSISDIIITDRFIVADIELGHNTKRIIHTLRIMIVDDSDLNRRILRKIIERVVAVHTSSSANISIAICECDDGAPAVEAMVVALIDACPYDYVFMDNIMIRMNGPEAALAMRKNGYRGYIIGVTGNVLAQDMNQFVQCGADFVLTKPVKQEQIKKALGW